MLYLLLLSACFEGGQVGPVKLAAARFEFDNVEVDDSCSEPYWEATGVELSGECGGFFDHCIQTKCSIQSKAEEAQTGVVVGTYSTPAGKKVEKQKEVSIGGGAQSVVTFDFEEASVGDDNPQVLCSVKRSDCVRVACDVTNTGDAAGTASFQAKFGGKSKPGSINLAPGQTRTMTFDFPGAKPEGQGLCQMMPTE